MHGGRSFLMSCFFAHGDTPDWLREIKEQLLIVTKEKAANKLAPGPGYLPVLQGKGNALSLSQARALPRLTAEARLVLAGCHSTMVTRDYIPGLHSL